VSNDDVDREVGVQNEGKIRVETRVCIETSAAHPSKMRASTGPNRAISDILVEVQLAGWIRTRNQN